MFWLCQFHSLVKIKFKMLPHNISDGSVYFIWNCWCGAVAGYFCHHTNDNNLTVHFFGNSVKKSLQLTLFLTEVVAAGSSSCFWLPTCQILWLKRTPNCTGILHSNVYFKFSPKWSWYCQNMCFANVLVWIKCPGKPDFTHLCSRLMKGWSCQEARR